MTLSTAQGLALIRAGFGLYLVVSALRKTTSGWLTNGEPVTKFVEGNLEKATPPYDAFLESFVLPNATTFAQLVTVGEWVAGISLLFGLLTRLGSLVGMWLVLNFMLAKGLANFEGSSDRFYFLMCFAFAAAAAGLVWGLDGKLRPTLEANPLTSWLAGIPGPSGLPMQRRLEAVPGRPERRDEKRRAA